jgi:hypothetical protein
LSVISPTFTCSRRTNNEDKTIELMVLISTGYVDLSSPSASEAKHLSDPNCTSRGDQRLLPLPLRPVLLVLVLCCTSAHHDTARPPSFLASLNNYNNHALSCAREPMHTDRFERPTVRALVVEVGLRRSYCKLPDITKQ